MEVKVVFVSDEWLLGTVPRSSASSEPTAGAMRINTEARLSGRTPAEP
jgi:hypothetical protein